MHLAAESGAHGADVDAAHALRTRIIGSRELHGLDAFDDGQHRIECGYRFFPLRQVTGYAECRDFNR